jgi:hypothetical protein
VELQFLPALFPEERAERRALALVSQRHVERALQARCRRPGPGERYQ